MQLLSPKWKIFARASCPEKVIERYYPLLREWAEILTRGDQARSEDIVHDLYLNIALTKPDLSKVESLDNYLYQSLRHAYLAALARASRESMYTVATSDFDSIRVALWARPVRDVLQQQNELRRICCYAVWRKAQMKGASYFILRFFHGYTLQEIGAIAGLPLSAVKPKLSEARADVREYIAGSSRLRLIGRAMPPEPIQLWTPVSWPNLSCELRAVILDGRTGPCLSEQELAMHYGSPVPKGVATARLSHIVSCERCLAAIDSMYRRPTLKDRELLDCVNGLDGEPSGQPARTPPASISRNLVKRVARHCEDLYQHHPETLSIAINGKIVASHENQAQRNVLSARSEKVDDSTYVEVLSEQGLCLAMLWFEHLPPGGPYRTTQRTNLSEDRWLDLTLTIDGQGLIAEVVYFAPQLAFVAVNYFSEDSEALSTEPGARAEVIESWEQGRPQREDNVTDPQKTLESSDGASRSLRLWSRLNNIFPAMNLTLATALVLGCGSVLYFLLWWHQPPKISADALMVRAEASDSLRQMNNQAGVICQRIDIKTPGRRIQRSLYRDMQGQRRLKKQGLSVSDTKLKAQLAVAGVDWDDPLSATSYQDWHDRQRVREDTITRVGAHLLKLTTTVPGGPVLQQYLTVRDNDFHPVERGIELQDAGIVEIAELNYEVMPWSAANESWFEPSSGQVLSNSERPTLAAVLPRILSDSELDSAELSARVMLHRLHADMGERIQVARSETGIQIRGFVETNGRKGEVVRNLLQVPHVQSSIWSVEELGRHPRLGSSPSSEVTQAYSVEAQPSVLEQYLSQKKIKLDQPDAMLRDLFDQAVRVQQAETHLFELQRSFKDPSRLRLDQRRQLTELSGSYIDAIDKGLGVNERSLASVGLGGSDRSDAPVQSSSDRLSGVPSEDLDREVRRYQELCRSLIASSTGQTQSAAVISDQLRESSARIRSSIARMHGPFSTAQN